MMKKDFIKVAACAAVFGVAGGAGFAGVSGMMSQYADQVIESPSKESVDVPVTSTLATTKTETGEAGSVSGVAENVLPSIVAIDVTVTETASDIWGRTYSQDAQGSGSGIIVAKDETYLYIATNNHVVSGSSNGSTASKVSVKFHDDSVYSATVKGTDSDSDLAVVQIPLKELSEETLNNIKVATLGNSEDVKVGDQAIAIGNALGYGTSVTVGYVSAKDREVAGEDVTMRLLQTDAAINPGNSGGALVDASGAVIGINSAKYADEAVEGMGFAIPISTAVPIVNDIIQSETVSEEEQGYLGIKGKDVSEEYAQYYNFPIGVYVAEVTEGSPAQDAGILQGDIITKLDGREVKSMDGLQQKLAKLKSGEKVEVVVKRADNGQYKEQTLTVTLGTKPSDMVNQTPQDGVTEDSLENGNSFLPGGR